MIRQPDAPFRPLGDVLGQLITLLSMRAFVFHLRRARDRTLSTEERRDALCDAFSVLRYTHKAGVTPWR